MEPSTIRHQTKSYAKAFQHFAANRLDIVSVNKWRAALKEAEDLSGHTLREEENGYVSLFGTAYFIYAIYKSEKIASTNQVCLNNP